MRGRDRSSQDCAASCSLADASFGAQDISGGDIRLPRRCTPLSPHVALQSDHSCHTIDAQGRTGIVGTAVGPAVGRSVGADEGKDVGADEGTVGAVVTISIVTVSSTALPFSCREAAQACKKSPTHTSPRLQSESCLHPYPTAQRGHSPSGVCG